MFNTLPLGGYKSFSCILLIQFQFTFMFFVNTSFGFQQHLNIAKGDASVSLHNNYCLRQQHCGLAVRNCIICEPFLFCYSEFVKKIRLNLLQGTEKKRKVLLLFYFSDFFSQGFCLISVVRHLVRLLRKFTHHLNKVLNEKKYWFVKL